MALSASAVKGIVLSLIGGIPILGILTARTNCAQPITAQISPLGLAGLALSIAAPELASKIANFAEDPTGALSDAITDKFDELVGDDISNIVGALGDSATGIDTAITNLRNAMVNGQSTMTAVDNQNSQYTNIGSPNAPDTPTDPFVGG